MRGKDENERRRTMPCEIRLIAADTPQNAFFDDLIFYFLHEKAGEE